MKARQLFCYKARQGDLICEMAIWALPATTPDQPHGLKCRLFWGRTGTRVVRYDNEAGKSDHRHYEERDEPYGLLSVGGATTG